MNWREAGMYWKLGCVRVQQSVERSRVPDDRLLTPGQTCWRIERADQFACIIDAADYFKHVKAAMQWRSAVASTSRSADGTPLRMSSAAAIAGRWGAATALDMTSRWQSTVPPRGHWATKPEPAGGPRPTDRCARSWPSTSHGPA